MISMGFDAQDVRETVNRIERREHDRRAVARQTPDRRFNVSPFVYAPSGMAVQVENVAKVIGQIKASSELEMDCVRFGQGNWDDFGTARRDVWGDAR